MKKYKKKWSYRKKSIIKIWLTIVTSVRLLLLLEIQSSIESGAHQIETEGRRKKRLKQAQSPHVRIHVVSKAIVIDHACLFDFVSPTTDRDYFFLSVGKKLAVSVLLLFGAISSHSSHKPIDMYRL